MSRVQELLQNTPPTTSLVIAVCTVLHLFQITIGPELSSLTLCPRFVLGLWADNGYRILTSAVFHGSFLHLGMNMLSMMAIGSMLEKHTGSLPLAVTIVYSILLTNCLYLAVAWLGYTWFNDTGLFYQHSVGFSGVLFHLSVLECRMGPMQPRSLFGVFSVSPALYPWVLLVVLQFLVPHLSFMGHLAGILVGTLQAYGCLESILPVDTTLQQLDGHLPRVCSTHHSFVPARTLALASSSTTTGSPVTGIGHVIGKAWTMVQQLAEAVYVILFGRGQRLNANLSLSRPVGHTLGQSTSTSPSQQSNTVSEQVRLTHVEAEMV